MTSAFRAALRTWRGRVGAAIVLLLVAATVGAPFIVPQDPLAVGSSRLAGPSSSHPLGTDEVGRDMLSRIVFGGRSSLGATFSALTLVVSLGVTLGSLAGFYRGWADVLLMRITDVLLAVPTLVLTLAIVGLFRPGLHTVVLGLSAVWWIRYARLTRALVMTWRERPFVEAAAALGAGDLHVLRHHILPNVLAPVMVAATLDIGTLILAIAGLSFLGLGAQPPAPEWGTMISDGKNLLFTAPHVMLFPGLAVTLAVLGFNLLSDSLQELAAGDRM